MLTAPSHCAARDPAGGPIFVSGCSRGGTTILSELLALHPDVCSVGRGPFHEGQFVWRRRFPDWSRHRWALPPWVWFLRRTARDATPARVRFFHQAFAEAMHRPGRMLEKTPANSVRLPFIAALYPDACFVHVLRDGRDTTASLMARRVPLAFAPHQWVAAHRIALADLRRLLPARVALVRFEGLLASPEATLREVWRRCGLTTADGPLTAALTEAAARVAQPVDRWARLPAWQQRYVLGVIGDLQRELGYPAEGSQTAPPVPQHAG